MFETKTNGIELTDMELLKINGGHNELAYDIGHTIGSAVNALLIFRGGRKKSHRRH